MAKSNVCYADVDHHSRNINSPALELLIPPSRRGIRVDPIDNSLDSKPQGDVRKHFYDTAAIGKRRLLKHRHIFHHAVVNDVLNDLIDKIDLIRIQLNAVQVFRERRLCRRHIQPHDLSHKLAQRLPSVFGFVFLFATDLTPQNTFKSLNILRIQRHITPQLRNNRFVLMLTDIELRFGLVILQIIAFQIRFIPFDGKDLLAEVRHVSHTFRDHQIVTATLPVVYDKCADALYELLDEYQPDVVLCLGQAVGREGISLEHAAVNVKASSSPDNAGVTFSGEKIVEDGAESLPSNLPLKELTGALREVGIPAKISYSAGTYVCNNLFYHLMEYAGEHARRMLCGFVHIPPCEAQKTDYAEGTPLMPTAEVVRAIKAIVAYMCA